MNITGYKKHLKEMKDLYKTEKKRRNSLTRNTKLNSLKYAIIRCQIKIRELQEAAEKKRSSIPRKKVKGRIPKGRRKIYVKKKKRNPTLSDTLRDYTPKK